MLSINLTKMSYSYNLFQFLTILSLIFEKEFEKKIKKIESKKNFYPHSKLDGFNSSKGENVIWPLMSPQAQITIL